MICHIFTGPCNYDVEQLYNILPNDFVIGVDQGANYLHKFQKRMNLALGDFDSVELSQFHNLETVADEIKQFPSMKDYTDTHLAVLEGFARGYSIIRIYGGLGERFDHSYANMNLLRLGDVTIIDDITKMYLLKPGNYHLENTHPFISFFALEEIENLSLNGFLYPLQKINLTPDNPLCISNQGEGEVSFESGLLLVIHQFDKK